MSEQCTSAVGIRKICITFILDYLRNIAIMFHVYDVQRWKDPSIPGIKTSDGPVPIVHNRTCVLDMA